MPELPEVETVRRGLAPALEGHVLVRAEVRRHDLRRPFPSRFAQRLTGRRVERLGRRGKYLLAALDGGETLVMHMGMSGRFTLSGRGDANGTGLHDHVVLETEDGARIVFTDPRRFGLMLLVASDGLETHELFRGYGPEPLDNSFDGESLGAALKTKRTPIKTALLDQRVVAGIGNIYACEALHRANISPRRLALSVVGARAARLAPAIKAVLGEAIAAGGSSLRDYARTDGELGYFQHRFAVYGREGKLCPSPGCEGRVKRLTQAGRSTWFCSACQR